MDALSTTLLEFGALGAICGGMFWMNTRLQQRQDRLLEKFTKQVREQEVQHQKAEDDEGPLFPIVPRHRWTPVTTKRGVFNPLNYPTLRSGGYDGTTHNFDKSGVCGALRKVRMTRTNA